MSTYKKGRPAAYNPSYGTGKEPSKKPGEYRIINEEGDIVYVGETNNLNRRTKEHIKSGKLNLDVDNDGLGYSIAYQVADGRSTSKTRREHERQKIDKHSPELNKSSGGEGRPAKKR